MDAPSKVPKSVVGLLAFGLLLVTPAASAFGMGVDAASVVEMKNAGATPQYAQIWVGSWVLRSGWSSIDAGLQKAEDVGATPVIQYYYWGDSISVNGVKYGQEGRTQSQWFSLAKTTATHAKNIMGDKPFLMVLEPEFNKNGVQHWEEFDGMLERMAKEIKAIAPNAKIVTGLGYWNDGAIFDRVVAQSSYVGFMLLRGSTRDSSSEAIGAADQVINTAKSLKAKWGKDIIVFDLGISSYGGWEDEQEAALQKFIDKRAALDAAGVKAIVWRYVYDNDYSSGYFGAAESHWGVKYESGGKKRAYDELVKLIQGSSGGTSAPSSPAPTTSTGTLTASFSDIKIEDWWVEVTVRGSEPIAKVEARVGSGAWIALTKQSWGDYARSIDTRSGQPVSFRATSSDGDVVTSGGGGGTTTPFDASFAPGGGNNWWVEVDVDANKPLRLVEARVNGGAWKALQLKSWGDWAASFYVPTGARVEFRATATDGAQDVSSAYTWPR